MPRVLYYFYTVQFREVIVGCVVSCESEERERMVDRVSGYPYPGHAVRGLCDVNCASIDRRLLPLQVLPPPRYSCIPQVPGSRIVTTRGYPYGYPYRVPGNRVPGTGVPVRGGTAVCIAAGYAYYLVAGYPGYPYRRGTPGHSELRC